MSRGYDMDFILKSLLSGGIAGMTSKTTVAPLDRIKILLQAHNNHYKDSRGIFYCAKKIIQSENLIALWKGNGAQMVRIFPYASIQFTSFEMYKKMLIGMNLTNTNKNIYSLISGSAAGVTAVMCTYPLDTIRARLAFQITGDVVKYNGIVSCAKIIVGSEGGIRALYRGFLPTICGMIPYAGLSFYCFETFKFLFVKYFNEMSTTRNRNFVDKSTNQLSMPFKLLCGGFAGAIAQTFSYPLDVTRRRMQLALMNDETKRFGNGMINTLKLIYKENGVVKGLYRGMSINYLRAIPMVAVSFTTYELIKQLLNLDTSISMKTG